MALKVTLAVALLAALCTAQQLQGNYVDDYQDYQDVPQRQAPRPPPPQRHSPVHSSSSNQPRPTPVPILKQINRHNEDGSYTYGYEGADGTFKIETKFPTGDVKGKYGFVDDTGKVRVVEYGADRYGFQPAGEGITVAPPTLVDETTKEDEEVERPRPRPSAPARFENRPPPPPPPRYESRPAPAPAPARFDSFEVQSRFQDEPHFAPRPKSPAPPRPLQVPGASPVGGSPAPQRPLLVPGAAPVSQSRPAPRPQPQVSRAFQPAQQFGPQQFAGPVVQQPVRQQSGGILDQLAKDYALPKGAGTPLHDISFGYY